MAVAESDVRFLLTVSTGPGNVYPQPNPSASLGGFTSHTPWSGGVAGDLFSKLPNTHGLTGQSDYRCIFVVNTNQSSSYPNVRVYIAVPAAESSLAVGVDPTPSSRLGSHAAQTVTVTTTYTAPVGVVFSAPSNYDSGLDLGTLLPGYGRAIWLRRTPASTLTIQSESATLAVRGGPAG